MFENIIILLKHGLNLDSKVIEIIREFSNGSKLNIVAFNDLKKDDLKEADLIITLGGDGTFIRAANITEDSLIIGINANPEASEGALTSLDINELEKLKDIFNGKFNVVKRYMAQVKLNGKLLDERALNELYVGTASQFHTSRYIIRFNGREEEQRSSGVLISTGTGSGAWFLSAGGKTFDPSDEKLGFVVREPYLGKRIFKPKMINGYLGKGEKIEIEAKRDFGGVIAINDTTYDFNNGDIVEVELSNKPLKVISLK